VFAGRVLEVVEEDLAHAGGDGAHLRVPEALGDTLARLLETLAHELAGEVHVQVVLEVDVHHRETEVRHGADLRHAGQAGHGRLDGVGDVGLDLLGRQALGHGEDLHEVGGDVGKGVHGQAGGGPCTGEHHEEAQHQHQQPVAQAEIY